MSFSQNKLLNFTKKISSLPDQPNMQPNDLKAYFDSSPEELRQTHNTLCDSLTATTAAAGLGFQRTAGVPADTVQSAVENVQSQISDAVLGNIPSGSVTNDKLAQDVRDHFTQIEQSVVAETDGRQAAFDNLQMQIHSQTTKIAEKCEVIYGRYVGDNTQNRVIYIGKTPKAVLLMTNYGVMDSPNEIACFGGLAVDTSNAYYYGEVGPVLSICENGFIVTVGGSNNCLASNRSNVVYNYIALV
ncbi:hypothetical protein [Candidatus Agathobaculum pullicola]|uniref:hypothetical protein n=1 Tax=Candidatus Agathobaculum pullicola TaxID=2838426 RepID=UPI003F8F5745